MNGPDAFHIQLIAHTGALAERDRGCQNGDGFHFVSAGPEKTAFRVVSDGNKGVRSGGGVQRGARGAGKTGDRLFLI